MAFFVWFLPARMDRRIAYWHVHNDGRRFDFYVRSGSSICGSKKIGAAARMDKHQVGKRLQIIHFIVGKRGNIRIVSEANFLDCDLWPEPKDIA
jgi:hypothetical protein